MLCAEAERDGGGGASAAAEPCLVVVEESATSGPTGTTAPGETTKIEN